MSNIRWFALPVLALPVYSIVVALQACGSGSSGGAAGTTTSAIVCAFGESAKKLNQHDVCCSGAEGSAQTCHAPGETPNGAPCTTPGATQPGTSYLATFDTCVHETCAGDRLCTTFALEAEKQTGTLACTGGTWQWQGSPTTHHVTRACLTARTEVCRGPGYDEINDETYGLEQAYGIGYDQVCGYGTYGAYSGPKSIPVRELFLISSRCTAAGATNDCAVDDL